MKTPTACNLLTDPVVPLILRLSLPSMAAMLASSLGTLADALILSRGDTQLSAAVSVSYALLTLIQTLGFTLGMGAGSFVSRSLGRGEQPAAETAASTAFFSALALSLLLCVPGALLAAPLVRLLGCPEAVVPAAAVYARYVLLSGPLLCAGLVLSSLLRGQGQTMPNMLAFSLGAALGIPLELLLVRRLGLGVHGGGIALLVRESVTLSVLAVSALRNPQLVRPHMKRVALRLSVWRDILRSGLPTLLRQGLVSLSSVLLTRESAAFGEAALAGMGLCVRASALIASAVIGFGQGFQPVCGAAFGAGDLERVRSAYRFCLRCAVIALSVIGGAVFAFAAPLLSLFGPETAVLAFACAALRAQSAVFFAQGAVIIMTMLTQALGLTVRASLVAASRQGFVLIPLLLILPRLFGARGLILCQSASDLLSLALCALLTRGALTGSSCARGECSGARTAFR